MVANKDFVGFLAWKTNQNLPSRFKLPTSHSKVRCCNHKASQLMILKELPAKKIMELLISFFDFSIQGR
jgi:hypothetical protein